MKVDKKLRTILMESGIVAAGNGYASEAKEIFDALEENGGNAVSLSVGRALASYGSGKAAEATLILTKQLEEKKSSEVDAMLALIAMNLDKSDIANEFLARCSNTGDGDLKNFSNALKSESSNKSRPMM